jgi:hypothetical protein
LIFDDPAEERVKHRPGSGFSPARVLLFPNITISKWDLVIFLDNKWYFKIANGHTYVSPPKKINWDQFFCAYFSFRETRRWPGAYF